MTDMLVVGVKCANANVLAAEKNAGVTDMLVVGVKRAHVNALAAEKKLRLSEGSGRETRTHKRTHRQKNE